MEFDKKKYQAKCCIFGFAPCPYYASMWSAEYRKWILAKGVQSAHMMDDWLVVGKSQQEAIKPLKMVSDTLESVGHEMQMEKTEMGQQMVFLGVLVDSIRMKLSFDATQAKGMMQ